MSADFDPVEQAKFIVRLMHTGAVFSSDDDCGYLIDYIDALVAALRHASYYIEKSTAGVDAEGDVLLHTIRGDVLLHTIRGDVLLHTIRHLLP